ncbi:hypothetical protein GCM10025875_15720 [Litorihabitans aurantiacus]|uniref:YDG domain-containing protein n=2 Tax=Litorihabitans aurantiacus TaxID=1930061 RepID=A0AA37XEI6_9MICO|nr:hypothetical protein GCM10025875_15720 [Litorihabitans aurantiacus]
MGGISGSYAEGADAIVVSGGYRDDEDHGDWILYTGQGGNVGRRQVADQELTRGNLALALSEERGLPVRVIRGAGGDPKLSPTTGYRYDGLYVVVRHWQEASVDGPLIWRFVLEREGAPGSSIAAVADPSDASAQRRESTQQRIVRNSAVTQWVKDLYGGRCQFCGIVLETAAGAYSEGAHVRALGSPNDGPDTVDNVLCLCPNDHVLFDKGALYVADGKIVRSHDGFVLGELTVRAGHTVREEHFAYHREHFAGVRRGA